MKPVAQVTSRRYVYYSICAGLGNVGAFNLAPPARAAPGPAFGVRVERSYYHIIRVYADSKVVAWLTFAPQTAYP